MVKRPASFGSMSSTIFEGGEVAKAEGSSSSEPPVKAGAFKPIKNELQVLKEKWNENFKPVWNRPPPPWPVRALRVIPCPEHADEMDIDELRVRLTIEGPQMDQLPVKVEIPQKSLPAQLQDAIAAAVEKKWRSFLKKQLKLPEADRSGGWQLQKIFEWCEKNYGVLLRTLPECLLKYEGTDRTGMLTIIRYSIVEPPPEGGDDDDDDDDEEDAQVELTAAQLEAIEVGKKLQEERERKRRIEQARLNEEKARIAEAKRLEAMELRESGNYVPPPKQLSKKELAEQADWKAKHKRQAKTGPAKKKYDGEGSAVERAKKGEGKKGPSKKK